MLFLAPVLSPVKWRYVVTRKVQILDCDGLLYPDARLNQQFFPLFDEFRKRHMGHDPDEHKWRALKQRIRSKLPNVTIMSMMVGYELGLNCAQVHQELHSKIDLKAAGIVRDERLIRKLSALPHRPFVWTNSPRTFCEAILGRLGVLELVERVIGADDVFPWVKPYPEGYHIVENFVEKTIGDEAAIEFADDSVANVRAAANHGWKAVWLNREGMPHDAPSHIRVISSLDEL